MEKIQIRQLELVSSNSFNLEYQFQDTQSTSAFIAKKPG